jgi:hypothetical protein
MLFKPRMMAEYVLNSAVGITLTNTCNRRNSVAKAQQAAGPAVNSLALNESLPHTPVFKVAAAVCLCFVS